jgi:hypothetical protein
VGRVFAFARRMPPTRRPDIAAPGYARRRSFTIDVHRSANYAGSSWDRRPSRCSEVRRIHRRDADRACKAAPRPGESHYSDHQWQAGDHGRYRTAAGSLVRRCPGTLDEPSGAARPSCCCTGSRETDQAPSDTARAARRENQQTRGDGLGTEELHRDHYKFLRYRET